MDTHYKMRDRQKVQVQMPAAVERITQKLFAKILPDCTFFWGLN